MSVSIQNFRSEVAGESPDFLCPGQLAFNLTDQVMFLGNGLNQRTDINGNPVLPNPPEGKGWQAYELGSGGGGAVASVTGSGAITASPTVGAVVLSALAASTTQSGVVQLTDSTSTTSSTTALTATGAKNLQDQINLLALSSNLTFAGTISGSTGFMLTVTAEGTTAGFAVGSAMPAAASGNSEFFVIVTVAGTMTPPGGLATGVQPADWWLSTGSSYLLIDAGQITPATPTVAGVVLGCTTSGYTALGQNALGANTSGSGNTAFGNRSLDCNQDGCFNTAVGANALSANVAGTNNTSVGFCALFNNTDTNNTAIGTLALRNNIAGSANVGIGSSSLINNSSGVCNVGVGTSALSGNTTGNSNVAVGINAGNLNTTGSQNVAIGPNVQLASATASGQLAIGYSSTNNWLTGDASRNIRPNAGIVDCGNSTGTNGQVLMSNGSSAICWGTVASSLTGTAPINVTAGSAPVVSVSASSTTATGVVQLYNNTNSTSTALALTAAQGKSLQDQITALVVAGSINLAGTINADTGLVASVTSLGVTDGFIVGSVLPAASVTTNNAYVIVTVAGTFTPPGGSPVVATQGDFILVTENSPGVYAWTFLNVGFDAPYASTSIAGSVCLSTNALALAGTDSLTAITPSVGSATYVFNSLYAAKGNILAATAANTPTALGVGTNGQALIADSTCTVGMKWGSVSTGPATPDTAGVVLGCTSSVSNTTSLGSLTLDSLTTGNNNTALGALTLFNVTTGGSNVAVGAGSLCVVVSGANNTAIGATAGDTITTGSQNVVIGSAVNVALGTASCQLAIGFGPGLNWLTGYSTQAIKPGAGIVDCAGLCGTIGQALLSTGSNAVCWGNVAVNAATPTVAGTVLGCTTGAFTALGCGSLQVNTAQRNTAVGLSALAANTTADGNTAIGHASQINTTTGVNNTTVGACTMSVNTIGGFNVAVGRNALFSNTFGCYNTAIGNNAGCSISIGLNNVAIGYGVQVASAIGNCQLAIGFETGQNWITGDSGKNIKPGAGIRDCANLLGTSTQVLTSTGTALQWATGIGFIPMWTSAGTVQSVGFVATGSTGTAAIPTTTLANDISYRQLGPRTYEVVGTLRFTNTTGGSNGTGTKYLLTLPAGLQFDTTLPYQQIFTGASTTAAFTGSYVLPGSTINGSQSNAFMTSGGIIPFNSTQYSILILSSTGSYDFWSPTYFEIVRTGGTGRTWSFQFTTPV